MRTLSFLRSYLSPNFIILILILLNLFKKLNDSPLTLHRSISSLWLSHHHNRIIQPRSSHLSLVHPILSFYIFLRWHPYIIRTNFSRRIYIMWSCLSMGTCGMRGDESGWGLTDFCETGCEVLKGGFGEIGFGERVLRCCALISDHRSGRCCAIKTTNLW